MGLYLTATTVSLILSSHRWVKLFGVLCLGSAVAAYAFYAHWFISVWCFFAAAMSIVVALHLIAARGEDLMIDPRGSGLSGGERRRIGLVRAIASGRPLLLLDEPTADLDPATAAQVIALLKDAARTRLVIAATHDPALIAEATSRVVMA